MFCCFWARVLQVSPILPSSHGLPGPVCALQSLRWSLLSPLRLHGACVGWWSLQLQTAQRAHDLGPCCLLPACSLLACSLLCPLSPHYHNRPTPAKPISTAPSTTLTSHRGYGQHPTSLLCLDPDTRATVGHLARLHGTLKKGDGPVTPSTAGICSNHAGTRTSPGRCLLLPA